MEKQYEAIANAIVQICKEQPFMQPFAMACNIQAAIQESAWEAFMNDAITQSQYRELGKDYIAKLIAPKFIAILEGKAA